jgi:hypothetical protein
MLWDNASGDLVPDNSGCVIIDYTVQSQKDGKIKLVYKQWSGAEHAVVRGIGVVVCLHHNPVLDKKGL